MDAATAVDWQPHAARLAAQTTHSVSRWRPIVAAVPRHLFVPNWWEWAEPGEFDSWTFALADRDRAAWLQAAYADRSLVTQVGPLHADHAEPGAKTRGRPTSSATLPSLLINLYRHAMIGEGMDVLDVGTGSGYGTALLAERLGDRHVTSVDVDSYLTKAAQQRLEQIGLQPDVRVCDATGPLEGEFDRIVATVSVRPVPASWLAVLRPGGRLVTTIADTGLIVTADKTPDGGAAGRIEWDRAGFMATRHGPDYPAPPDLPDGWDGEERSSPYPVVDVVEAWELWSMLSILCPGIRHHYRRDGDRRQAWMVHPDGSWAHAVSSGDGPATVRQGGPRRLWDLLDDLRARWLRDGSLPVYGARVTITPDGATVLRRGRWTATL